MNQETKSKKTIVYSGIGLAAGLLMLGNTYFLLDNNMLKEINQKHIYQVNSLTASNNSLEKSIATKNEELNKYKTEKSTLESLLVDANNGIEAGKLKIAALSKENAALNYLRKEVVQLRKLKNEYSDKISSLQSRISFLSDELTNMKGENDLLKQKISVLESRNGVLEKKVEIASIIKIENIKGEGQKKLKGNKFVRVLRAKKADRVAVSFDLTDNRVAENGNKTVYIRIIDPKGKVVYNDAKESGTFVNLDNQQSLDFTKMETVEYAAKRERVTVFYDLNGDDFTRGEYRLDFYTDGYFSGSSKFTLK